MRISSRTCEYIQSLKNAIQPVESRLTLLCSYEGDEAPSAPSQPAAPAFQPKIETSAVPPQQEQPDTKKEETQHDWNNGQSHHYEDQTANHEDNDVNMNGHAQGDGYGNGQPAALDDNYGPVGIKEDG